MKTKFRPVVCVGLALIGLSGCQRGTVTTPATIAAPTQAPAPSAPATTVAPATAAAPANSPNAWRIGEPHDPAVPELLQRTADSYAVPADWKVARIEYVYRWWGLAPNPIFDRQEITFQDGAYRGISGMVSSSRVWALVTALSNFHPVATLLSGQSHTDDYPTWTVLITGRDGQQIWLNSSSTMTATAAPWNLYSNGRLFAQYDGRLARPLFDLFSPQQAEYAASMSVGTDHPNLLAYSASGLPLELTYGFSGLGALEDRFQYEVMPISATLRGTLVGRESIGGFGNMVIGTIVQMKKVELSTGAQQSVDCPIEALASKDPAGAAWTFTCPVPARRMGEPFHYPIQIDFETADGKTHRSSGTLHGRWQEHAEIFKLALPDELQSAFDANPAAHAVLGKHMVAYVSAGGEIDPSQDKLPRRTVGWITLAGTTSTAGHPVRYTVMTPFHVEAGQLKRWDLDPQALQAFLQDVLASPLTQRALQAEPNLILALIYVKSPEALPTIDGMLDRTGGPVTLKITACAGLPGADIYPTAQEPVRAFAFNTQFSIQPDPQFVLLNGEPVVYGLRVSPHEQGKLAEVLLPTELRGLAELPYQYVSIGRDFYSRGLDINVGDDAAPEVVRTGKALISKLPFPVDTEKYKTLWLAEAVSAKVGPDGTLTLVTCK